MRTLWKEAAGAACASGMSGASRPLNTHWYCWHFCRCRLPLQPCGTQEETEGFSTLPLGHRHISSVEAILLGQRVTSPCSSARGNAGRDPSLAGVCERQSLIAGVDRSQRGQATVEAAAILPAVSLVLALLLQPVCLSYTRAVMHEAAAECARASATAYGGDTGACSEFALRRLAAVPEVALFHVGGKSDWEVTINRTEKHSEVLIRGHARPLPLMGAVMALAGQSDGQGILLEARVSEDTRPEWLEGSYADWQSIWE